VGTWVNKAKTMLTVLLLLLATIFISSCSELRSEFDPHKWRYQPYRNMPPSWENDMGRPGPEDCGEDMFGDSW
jgi:hypothetical protein